MMKPKPMSYVMGTVGLLGNIFIFAVASDIDATASGAGSYFNLMYYLMVGPMFLTTGLIYLIIEHEKQNGRSKSDRAKIYLTATVLALSLTVHAAYRIKEAKEAAGMSFPSSAKERMEQYKTDLFKGRLKKFKDPNPDTSHIPYEEQVRNAREGKWEDENSVPEKERQNIEQGD